MFITRRKIETLAKLRGSLFVLQLVSILAVGVLLVCCAAAFVPLETSDTSILVRKGGDFQAALDRARPGDTVLLEAGATFKGTFKLPKKVGNEFVTIRPAMSDSELPGEGVRLDPGRYAAVLPKLLSNAIGEPAVMAADGAHHYRFVSIEFGPTPNGSGNIIQIGTGSERSVADLPHHIELDRVFIHGNPEFGQRRAIAANGKFLKIINSYISDIKLKAEESQAIAAWATDGPIEIVNNYLEAAGENILFGGGASYLKLVPTDCVVSDNYLNKPIEWMKQPWVVKNIFEIKNGRRIKVTNNLMTNNWAAGQDGTAILFTTRADNGPATIIEEIEFSGNIVRGSSGAVNILGNEGSGGHKLLIQNNLFEDIGGEKWGGAGHFLKSNSWDGLTIENNTIIQSGNITNAYGDPVKNFVFRNNIVFENLYGIKGENMGSGQEVVDKLFSNGLVAGNIIIGGRSSSYRDANYYPSSPAEIGFANPSIGDYRLKPNSPYFGKGIGGKSIGANLDPSVVGKTRATEMKRAPRPV